MKYREAMRTRVKVCGLTRPQDARKAAELGADAIGLVFYPASPRCIEIEQACKIVAEITPFVSVVALFVNAQKQQVESVLREVRVDILQFHGDEDEAYCMSFARPYIKAISVKSRSQTVTSATLYASAKALLLDRFDKEKKGGTGKLFDWGMIPGELEKPVILAGGLTPENVVKAIKQIRPYAVDVSSGVESSPGIKDAEKMRLFMRNVAEMGS